MTESDLLHTVLGLMNLLIRKGVDKHEDKNKTKNGKDDIHDSTHCCKEREMECMECRLKTGVYSDSCEREHDINIIRGKLENIHDLGWRMGDTSSFRERHRKSSNVQQRTGIREQTQ